MIEEIRIRDLGVIDEAVLPLHRGLTVLTGETGAGKTMVVTALGLLLGGRGDSALVRTGAERAVVEGVLDLPEAHPALERAADAGGDTTDGLVLVRSVSADGRSRAHVGGRAAPVGLLGELAEHLVAVHGQADQWRLKRADQHREVVDAFGGPALAAALTAYREVHTALTPPRPSSTTSAAPPPSARGRPTACGSASSGSRRSTHSPGRTPTCGSSPSASGTPRSCAPAPETPTPSSPATTTPRPHRACSTRSPPPPPASVP